MKLHLREIRIGDMKFVGILYFTQTEGWYLLGMWYMRMRKVSCFMTSCYYPSWVHSHRTTAHCTFLGILDVFSLHAITEESVAPTNSSPVFFPIISSPRTAPDTPTAPQGSSRDVWSVLIFVLSCVCETHMISDVCEVTAVLPVPETQNFEHHFRIKTIVDNVTSDLFSKHLKLNENLHLHIVLTLIFIWPCIIN
jgi:hypothetical protein